VSRAQRYSDLAWFSVTHVLLSRVTDRTNGGFQEEFFAVKAPAEAEPLAEASVLQRATWIE
jgi:hypothetical protein